MASVTHGRSSCQLRKQRYRCKYLNVPTKRSRLLEQPQQRKLTVLTGFKRSGMLRQLWNPSTSVFCGKPPPIAPSHGAH